MILSEYINGDNFFQRITAINPQPFLTGSEDYFNMSLDMLYGQRTVFKPIESWTVENLANVINSHFKDKWGYYIREVAATEKIDNEKTVTETITTNETNDITGGEVDKIAAYNSVEMVNKEGRNRTGNEVKQGTVTKTNTESFNDVEKTFKMLSIAGKESIISKVVKDVGNFITVNIY